MATHVGRSLGLLIQFLKEPGEFDGRIAELVAGLEARPDYDPALHPKGVDQWVRLLSMRPFQFHFIRFGWSYSPSRFSASGRIRMYRDRNRRRSTYDERMRRELGRASARQAA